MKFLSIPSFMFCMCLFLLQNHTVCYGQGAAAGAGSYSGVANAHISINSLRTINAKGYDKKSIGDNYIDSEWQMADIRMIDDDNEYQDREVRIDVKSKVIEIKYKDKIKILPSYMTGEINLKTGTVGTYKSKKSLGIEGPKGFYRVVYSGKTKLFCHYSSRIIPSNYNIVLDTGSKDDKIVLIEAYYILNQKQELVKLENKKGKLLEQLDGGESLQKFAKKNGINIKKEKDLITLIEFVDKNIVSN